MNLAIFDIDGTLTESVAVDEACFVQAFRDVSLLERNTEFGLGLRRLSQFFQYTTQAVVVLGQGIAVPSDGGVLQGQRLVLLDGDAEFGLRLGMFAPDCLPTLEVASRSPSPLNLVRSSRGQLDCGHGRQRPVRTGPRSPTP
jgi:hypothetical protein